MTGKFCDMRSSFVARARFAVVDASGGLDDDDDDTTTYRLRPGFAVNKPEFDVVYARFEGKNIPILFSVT